MNTDSEEKIEKEEKGNQPQVEKKPEEPQPVPIRTEEVPPTKNSSPLRRVSDAY